MHLSRHTTVKHAHRARLQLVERFAWQAQQGAVVALVPMRARAARSLRSVFSTATVIRPVYSAAG
jgi:hypothetical protein